MSLKTTIYLLSVSKFYCYSILSLFDVRLAHKVVRWFRNPYCDTIKNYFMKTIIIHSTLHQQRLEFSIGNLQTAYYYFSEIYSRAVRAHKPTTKARVNNVDAAMIADHLQTAAGLAAFFRFYWDRGPAVIARPGRAQFGHESVARISSGRLLRNRSGRAEVCIGRALILFPRPPPAVALFALRDCTR